MAKRRQTKNVSEPGDGMKLVHIKLIGPGQFDVKMDTPDGTVREYPIRYRQIESRVATLASVTDPVARKSYRYWCFIKQQFPDRSESLEGLRMFAEAVGWEHPTSLIDGTPVAIQDAGRMWDFLFAETNVVSEDLVGSNDITIPPDDVLGDDLEKVDVATGLEDADGKD